MLLFQKYEFRLILSMNSVQKALRMIFLLRTSDCSAFYALPVEHGCWWLPLMKDGEKCLGAPALRPPEFAKVLDQTLKKIRSQFRIAPRRLRELAYENVRALTAAS